MRSAEDLTATARIRDAAIDQFGRDGFAVGVRAIAKAAGVSPGLVIHHFGSKDGLRKVVRRLHRRDHPCLPSQRTIQTADPATWFAQMAEIEDYAPMMAYLVRSLQTGGDLAKTLWRNMIDNAEQYIEEGVRAGTIKPSEDPRAGPASWPWPAAAASCSTCRCTTTRRISARCFTTTARTWCCPPSSCTPTA